MGISQKENVVNYLKYEKTFIIDLENYIESQESVLQLLRKKLLNFKVEHSDALENPEKYFSNELNKFLIIKRLASDVELLSEKTFDVAKRFQSKVNSYKEKSFSPTKSDLMESALSIARLQKAQNLRSDKLAKGIFGDVKKRWLKNINWVRNLQSEIWCAFRNGLSTEDCYQVGKQLNVAQVYSSAIEWLTEAMKRYDEYYDQHQVKAVEILEELALSFLGNNQIQEAEKIVEKVSRMNANSHVVKFFKSNETPVDSKYKTSPTEKSSSKKAENKVESKTKKMLCHSSQFLRSNIFTCPS